MINTLRRPLAPRRMVASLRGGRGSTILGQDSSPPLALRPVARLRPRNRGSDGLLCCVLPAGQKARHDDVVQIRE
eukprot:7376962-Prymnesium_polylepis.1